VQPVESWGGFTLLWLSLVPGCALLSVKVQDFTCSYLVVFCNFEV